MCSKKRAALPEFDRQGKHVVAIARRPIRDGHARFIARHQAAQPEQQKRRHRRQHGEPVQRAVEFLRRGFVHSKNDRRNFSKSQRSPQLKFISTSNAGKTRGHIGVFDLDVERLFAQFPDERR